jgi:uroporphyrinogen decarboxylase
MNSKQRFLSACLGEPVDRPPVWMMRQAGRTLPEYRALKEQHSFWDMMTTPQLAAEVTMQPLRRFKLDAAVIFSDILTIPAAMGQDVQFSPKLALDPVIGSESDVQGLNTSGITDKLSYVGDALRETRKELTGERALLGFSGAPYTLASYMVEGGSSKTYHRIKALMYQAPDVYHQLLDKLAEAVAEYLEMQVEAGADAVQLFDSWAGELSPPDFNRFALPYVQRVVSRVTDMGAKIIYYINGMGTLVEGMKASGAHVLGADWRIELATVRARAGRDTVVQGNLDPGALFGAPEEIRRRTFAMLDQTGGVGHIANLGHGLDPATPLEGIQAFVDAVHEWPARKGSTE